jgi:uncharacterized protein (TIGR03503 family)
MNRILRPAVTLLLALVAGLVLAQDDTRSKPADVRLVIDVSGSMKQNDPANLRQPAVELLMQLMPEDSKAGIWTFGRYINMLVPHKPVNDRWRTDATEKSEQINSLGLFTNIGEALEKAAYDFDRASPAYNTSIILLTDGMVDIDKDPDKNQAEWRRIVDEVLPKLQQAGYKIHTIALSDKADTALMEKLSLGTDGLSEVAKTADDLMKVFLRIFDQAAPAEQVPLEGNRFLVDSSIEEFTALIFRNSDVEPTRLISPDETEYRFDRETSDVNWYKTQDYDLITVKRPLEGEWQVVADIDPDSRVTVVSNLNLLVKPLPTNLFTGQQTQLSLLFQEDQRTVTDRNFLSLLTIDSLVDHTDSGREWPELLSEGSPPGNGIYSTELSMFADEGRYQVSVNVDGKSFQRKFNHHLTVREPFAVSLDKLVLGGREQQKLLVRAHSQVVVPAETQVVARIKDPNGRSSIKPMQLTPTDEWELILQPEVEGTYQVRLRISGIDSHGQSFNVDPPVQRFNYPSADNPFSQPAPQPEPEPEPEPEPQPQPEPQLEPEPAPEPVEQEDESSDWMLYVGLGIGNLLVVVLAFFAYRMVMGSGKGDSLKDLEKAVDDAEEDDLDDAPEEPAAVPELQPEPEPEPPAPQMEAMPEAESVLDDDDLTEMPMDAGLDLSSDDVTEQEIQLDDEVAADELLAGLEEPLDQGEVDDLDDILGDDLDSDLAGELGDDLADELGDDLMESLEAESQAAEDELAGFSLDDFAPESLDELDDDKDNDKA